jgi:hypothetical protein
MPPSEPELQSSPIRSLPLVTATVPVASSSRLVPSASSPSRDLGQEQEQEQVLAPARTSFSSSPEFGTQAGIVDDFTDVVPVVASPDRSGDMEMSPIQEGPPESSSVAYSLRFGIMPTVLDTPEFS